MTNTNVRAHPRKGTKGVKRHSREIPDKKEVSHRTGNEYKKNYREAFNNIARTKRKYLEEKKENPRLYDKTSRHYPTMNRVRNLKKAGMLIDYYDRQLTYGEKSYIVDTNSPSYTHKPYTQQLVFMTPTEFLELSTDVVSPKTSSLDYISDRMDRGLPLEPPYLEVDVDENRVTSHEGRHRCMVARNKGIGKIPVIIVHREGNGTIPATAKINHRFLFKQRSRR